MLANKLNKGDTIGVVAPSNPIVGDNIEELEKARRIIEATGFKVKYSKNLFSNSNRYSATAREKADDINSMFKDQEVKMVWCAKGGQNSNAVLDYLDYETIQQNPKIICGFSDITSITNAIYQKTGLITFSSTNFKTIATDETDYSLNETLKRLVDLNLDLGTEEDEDIVINEGTAEGILIGGNLSLMYGLTCGKYALDFQDKILFLEEFALESEPSLVSNHLYYMKQNGVFDRIKGLWIGTYEHESKIELEQIVIDTIGENIKFPIIKSNYFGHVERKTAIPIGTKAEINTQNKRKITLLENCVKSL